jgi:diguanylate cyclase (GGDEF)-like protein
MLLSEPDCSASDTLKTPAQLPGRGINQGACVVYIYPTGPLMGSRFFLGREPVRFGRGDDCQVQIPDASVSRAHAEIRPGSDGRYNVIDLGSTNGTFVNNVLQRECLLADGDYLRIGNCIFRFLAGGNVESEYHEEIYRLTILDALTGIPNRRYFEEFVDRELVRAIRHRRPLALALLDVDHFKAVNDRLGHLAGDLALRQLAACTGAGIRKDELLARYGGEEFAIVLPELDPVAARTVCERIRHTIESHDFSSNKHAFRMTVSIGVAVKLGDQMATVNELVRRADAMLYQAKQMGRNRVCSE